MDTTVADPLIGLTLDGRYRILSRIARGGMATVYLARDTRLDRTVALKIMHRVLAEDIQFVRRFIDEAKSVARLSHPNVVAVYDQGTDQGYVFLAMEYVPGRPLRNLLAEWGRLSPTAALDVMIPVLSGLAAAHQVGIVHRDVKPENVLLTPEGQVKVVDFGLAQAVEATSGHTQTGYFIGTVGYLAPERVAAGRADARSDVYAAGVMLFELLTGRQPHVGDSPLSVAYKHVHEPVPAPSSLVPDVPPSVDALVGLATARDPARRPPDAGSLLRAALQVRRGIGPPGLMPPAPVRAAGTAPDPTAVMQQAPRQPTLVVPREELEEDPGRARHTQRPRRRGGRSALVVSLAAMLVLAVGGLGWWLMVGRFVSVPTLTGLTVSAATSKTHALGLRVRQGAARHSDTVPAGKVVATDPAAGTRIPRHGVITLYLSSGPRLFPMPDVTNKPLDTARQLLRDAGLVPGATSTQFSPGAAKGLVLATDPPAGQQVAHGRRVALVVSGGIEVPDLTNQAYPVAQLQLSQLGLNSVVKQQPSAAPPGVVVDQSPKPHAGASPGDVVTLVVSSGPQMVAVPDVRGWALKDAVKALRDAGFKVNVHRIFGGSRVQGTNPTGQAPHGATIDVWAIGP